MVTARKPPHVTKKPSGRKKPQRPFDALAFLLNAGTRIPDEELARMPRDLSYNFDYYHDGSPKQP